MWRWWRADRTAAGLHERTRREYVQNQVERGRKTKRRRDLAAVFTLWQVTRNAEIPVLQHGVMVF